MKITISNLHKSYSGQQVLSGINAEFEQGKIYGIVGENGSGKTTFFKCLTGLEIFEGNLQTDIQPLKHQIGYLQTEPYFLPKLTGEEYIRLLTRARGVQIENLEQKNIFHLPLHHYATTYSTGMKKKLALLAVLLQQNKILILDEPFNGVDIQSNILITEILKSLQNLGKIILISSHIFSTLNELCDEILLLQNGIFSRRVFKSEFDLLEKEMKDVLIGSKISRLELQ